MSVIGSVRELRRALARVDTARKTLDHIRDNSRILKVIRYNLDRYAQELSYEIEDRAVPQRGRRIRSAKCRTSGTSEAKSLAEVIAGENMEPESQTPDPGPSTVQESE